MPTSSAPDPWLCVVVVVHDGEDVVGPCLASVARAGLVAGGGVEAVVVDNASRDGSRALVASAFPDVRLVPSPRNLGFAGGCNLAVRASAAPWVLLLNSDAVLADDALARLRDAVRDAGDEVAALTLRVLLAARFEEDPAGDVVGPQGRYREAGDGEVRLVNSTGNVLRRDLYGVDRGWLVPDRQHRPDREVFGVCGAAAALRRSAWEQLGGFDESFFLYYEDSDLSWRLRLAGWEVEYLDDARVDHLHSASTGEGSDLSVFHNERNRLLMAVKNAPAGVALRTVARGFVTPATRLRGQWPSTAGTRPRLRALASFVRLVPQALAHRRAASRRGVSAARRRAVYATFPATSREPVGGYRT